MPSKLTQGLADRKRSFMLVASFCLSLEKLDNLTLAALNNAIQLFGHIATGNIAFVQALDAGLIKKDGKPLDLEALRDASAFEVNRRVQAGVFE